MATWPKQSEKCNLEGRVYWESSFARDVGSFCDGCKCIEVFNEYLHCQSIKRILATPRFSTHGGINPYKYQNPLAEDVIVQAISYSLSKRLLRHTRKAHNEEASLCFKGKETIIDLIKMQAKYFSTSFFY